MRPKRAKESETQTELVRFKNEYNSYTRGAIRDFIYQEWEEKYLDDIKDPTLRTIIKTLENSPQEGIDNKKFYEYSNIGINNWISITETYSDALILLEYCLKKSWKVSNRCQNDKSSI